MPLEVVANSRRRVELHDREGESASAAVVAIDGMILSVKVQADGHNHLQGSMD